MDIRNNSVKSPRRLLGAVHSPITDPDSGHGVSSSEDSADSVKLKPITRSVKLIAQETAWLALEEQPSRSEGRARSMRRSLRRRHLTLASPRSRRSLVAVASRWRRIPLPSRIPACRLAAGELLLSRRCRRLAARAELEPSLSCMLRALVRPLLGRSRSGGSSPSAVAYLSVALVARRFRCSCLAAIASLSSRHASRTRRSAAVLRCVSCLQRVARPFACLPLMIPSKVG